MIRARARDDELAAQTFEHRRALRLLSHGIRTRHLRAPRGLDLTSHGFEVFASVDPR